MERVRKTNFSGSWYPGMDLDVKKQLQKWDDDLYPFDKMIISGVVPHAGWYFSGKIAYDLIRRFDPELEFLFVIGGHLPQESPILYCDEDYFETPCGKLQIEKEYINLIIKYLPSRYDNRADNTIEVQLPIIKALFENVKIIPLRVPAGKSCLKLIDVVERYSTENNHKIGILGSTDLTHYGSNYDFAPIDSMRDPIKWVEKSDRKILNAMVELIPEDILDLAAENHSACSAGAAACAASFAALRGVKKGRLITYDTSYSKHEAESFVGYGSVAYEV